MTDREPTAIEALRERMQAAFKSSCADTCQMRHLGVCQCVTSLIEAIGIPPETLAALASGEMVVVPAVPTEAMCDAGWIDKEDVSPREIWAAMLAALPDPNPTDNPPMAMTEGR